MTEQLNAKLPTPQPRFGGDVLWLVFIFLSGLVGGTTMLLLHVGHYFDSSAPGVTTTVTGADGTTTSTVTTESLFLLNPARFAIVMLIAFGLLLVVGGVVLALADMTKTPETVEAVVTPVGDDLRAAIAPARRRSAPSSRGRWRAWRACSGP